MRSSLSIAAFFSLVCCSSYAQLSCDTGSCIMQLPDDQSIITDELVFNAYCPSGEGKFCDGRSQCCGVWCELGFLTADHCPSITGSFRFPDLDIRLSFSNQTGEPDALQVSTGVPHHFYDRRGYKVLLDYLDTQDGFHRTRGMFFPGESGSGVYDIEGRVCGVVSANVYTDRSTWGSVASVAELLSAASSKGRRLRRESRQRRELRSASDSILEREATSLAPQAKTSVRQTMVFLGRPPTDNGHCELPAGPLQFQLQ